MATNSPRVSTAARSSQVRAGPVRTSTPRSTRSSGGSLSRWPTTSRASIARAGARTPTCTGLSLTSRPGTGSPSSSAAVAWEKNAPCGILTSSAWHRVSTSNRLTYGLPVAALAGARMPQNGRSRSPPSSREVPTPARTASPTRMGRPAQPSGSGMRAVIARESPISAFPAEVLHTAPRPESSCGHPAFVSSAKAGCPQLNSGNVLPAFRDLCLSAFVLTSKNKRV